MKDNCYISSIGLNDYIAGYRDAEMFMTCCRHCGNYGKTWGCPPYDYDAAERLAAYKYATLIAVKIVPPVADAPIEDAFKILNPSRCVLHRLLLDEERVNGGFAFSFAGRCIYCPEGECTRPKGEKCRHPELVRPSLEAWGFDVGGSASEILGFDLKWSKNGRVPEYFTLVSGVLHNDNPEDVERRLREKFYDFQAH